MQQNLFIEIVAKLDILSKLLHFNLNKINSLNVKQQLSIALINTKSGKVGE